MRGFGKAITDANPFDIPLQGHPFMWWRSKGTIDEVEESLDRAMSRQDLLDLFPDCNLLNSFAIVSNHSSIILNLFRHDYLSKKKRNFRLRNC